jgi:hypothetical protein
MIRCYRWSDRHDGFAQRRSGQRRLWHHPLVMASSIVDAAFPDVDVFVDEVLAELDAIERVIRSGGYLSEHLRQFNRRLESKSHRLPRANYKQVLRCRIPAFEHTDISAAHIRNGLELYHVNPSVVPAAPGYDGERVRRIEQASVGVPW